MKVDVFKPEDFHELTNWHHAKIADIANRILEERSVPVYGNPPSACHNQYTDWRGPAKPWSTTTHQALLIAVQPIAKPDTAESLLREMLNLEQSVTWRMPADVLKRVHALLDQAKAKG